MRILLVCSSGMSTSLVMKKMRTAAVNDGKDIEIRAASFSVVEDELGNFDVLLLGPQIRNRLDSCRKIVGNLAPVELIPSRDYGIGDGKAINDFAEKILKEFKESK